MMLIDGKKINHEIGEKLFNEIKDRNIKPSLGILFVGDDPASRSFINEKKKFGEKWGFSVNIYSESNILNSENNVQDYKNKIKQTLIKMQTENDAVIVQLPLPENLKVYTDEILLQIQKSKDVDNLNDGIFIAPIVSALKKILNEVQDLNFSKAKFGIVGLGQVVGAPIKKYLDENSFDVVVVGRNEYEKLIDCTVVISGVGIPFLIKKENIKDDAVLIDYGCSFIPDPRGSGMVACGDFDPGCFEKSSYYTPVPGCMGPLVVASLFENVLESAKRNIKL